MGISAAVGLSAAAASVVFLTLKLSSLTLVALPFLYFSLVSILVSIASLPSVDLPLLLGKKPDGSFPLWSLLLFAPFLVCTRLYVLAKRLCRRKRPEPPYSEISPGLYLGGWPSSLNRVPPGEPAVIDCTCELPRTSCVSKNTYLCIAAWDTRSAAPSAIESAVRWAARQRTQKRPIFIHCAFGHGRSACVMSAVLVSFGIAQDWKDAEKIVRDKRPYVRMNALQRKNLEEWSRNRFAKSKRIDENTVTQLIFAADRK